MFIRFVRNSRTSGGGKKTHFKLAAICLGIAIAVSLVNTIVCRLTDADSLIGWACDYAYGKVSQATVSIYKFVTRNEYNVAAYTDGMRHSNEEDNLTTDFMEAINSQNNLYSYINEASTEIALSCYDPSYADEKFSGTMIVDAKPQSEPVSGDEPKTDSGEKNTDVQVADGGYTIPPIADKGITYSEEQLSDFNFLMSKLYIVPDRAKVLESELVASEMLAKDMTMQGDNSKPQILIYHTHSQEGFADSVAGDESTTIVGVGDYLAKILSEVYGYNVIHCTEKFDMKSGTLDRSEAYTYAGNTVTQILEDNPSIEVVLDIHRDGLAEGADKLVTNINGKDTAKIMFFNGVSRSSKTGDIDYLYNRYKEDNLAFSFQLKLKALECYPDFTRRNYIDAYQYNLHLRPKSVLIEVGAQNNTLQEELNAMEVLAEVLHQVLQ